jgi:hypothetical protein
MVIDGVGSGQDMREEARKTVGGNIHSEAPLIWSQCPSWPLIHVDSNKLSNKKQENCKLLKERVLLT